MLRHQRQVSRKIQKLVDAFLFSISLYLAYLLRSTLKFEVFGGTKEIYAFREYAWLCLVIFPVTPPLLQALGFYSRPLIAPRKATAWKLFKACLWSTLGVIVIMWLMRQGSLIARSVPIFFAVVSFALVFLKEELLRYWRQTTLGQAQHKRKLILVGTPEETVRLQSEILSSKHDGFAVVERLNINESPIGTLVSMVHEHSANGVIMAAQHTYFGQIEQTIEACEREGVEVWLLADFFKTQISQTTVDDFYGRPMLVFRSGPETSWQRVAKNIMDLVGSAFLLALLALPMLFVALLIKLTSPGPVLFRQRRSGLNGEPFTMLKFRSMVTDAEQLKHELDVLNEMTGPVFKVSNDPRVTPLGRQMRRFSIDELPQLVNVLRGEMSLVGPRPLPVDEVRRFDDLAHRRRLSVRPGLTCLWQVSGRNNVRDFKEWVRLDLDYIDHWSLWLDLKILARTVPAVFHGTGAK